MSDSGLIYLLWSDLVGMTRTRGVPLRDFDKRLESGLGWANAGQAMTPFEHLADNPWGPVDEVRQIPDPDTRFEIPAADGHPALHAVICDSRPAPGEDWDCCVRNFCRCDSRLWPWNRDWRTFIWQGHRATVIAFAL